MFSSTPIYNERLIQARPSINPNSLPELLRLSDDIWLQVFTHRSFYARPTHLFEDPPDNPSPDNEILEHLGDAVLCLIVTQLIQEKWPYLRVGPATKIRSRVVGNSTLAALSRTYNLPRWLRIHEAQSVTLKNSLKVQADLFEAYLGGIYLDKGFETVKLWLCDVMQNVVLDAYAAVREEHGLTPMDTEPPIKRSKEKDETRYTDRSAVIATSTVGHLALFNQHCQQADSNVEWRYCDLPAGTKTTPVWTVDAFVNKEYVGSGRGNTKKAAKNDAAKQALKYMGVAMVSAQFAALKFVFIRDNEYSLDPKNLSVNALPGRVHTMRMTALLLTRSAGQVMMRSFTQVLVPPASPDT